MHLGSIKRTAVTFSALFVGVLAGCSSDDGGSSSGGSSSGGSSSGGSSGGSSSGGSSSGGSSSGNSSSSSSSSSGGESASCCLGSSYYSCPSSDAADACFSKGSPGECTRQASNDGKCCSSSGFSCSSNSECCSGRCVDDPESEGDKICE